MRLGAYLEHKGLSETAFARMVGVSQPVIHRTRRGLVVPRVDTIRRIIEVTQGMVTEADILAPALQRPTQTVRKRRVRARSK